MRTLMLLLLLSLAPAVASAQMQGDKELTGYFGWQYGGTQEYVTSYYTFPSGDFHANANINYGGSLTVFIKDYYGAELMYTYQGTDLLIRPATAPSTTIGDLTTHYMHIYGVRTVPVQPGKTDAYVLGGLGATVYDLKADSRLTQDDFDSRWLFSFGMGVGVKIHTSEKVAIKLQTRLLIPVQWTSAGFYFGSGGSGISVGGGSSIAQGDVSLGLTAKLGK